MNCNRLAPFYKVFEYAAFGRRLQWHRTLLLPALSHPRRALILGDGDGRFAVQLLRQHPDLVADYVDLSPRMRQLTERGLSAAGSEVRSRCRLITADALETNFPAADYDLVATHFFLDCFSAADLDRLTEKIVQHLLEHGLWIVSDFNQPASGWRAVHARLWLFAMYRFFALFTDLETPRLPDYRSVLAAHGLCLCEEQKSFGQLVCSQLWKREKSEAECAVNSPVQSAAACR